MVLVAGLAVFAAATCLVVWRAIVLLRRAEDARKALAASEATLAQAQRIGNMGSWAWDITTNKLVWSDQVYRIFGMNPQVQPTYADYLGLVHPDDRLRLVEAIRSATDSREPYKCRHRVVRPDGEVRLLDAQGEARFSSTGEPLELMGTCHDVTDLVALQVQTEEERRKQREMLDSMFVFVGLFGPDGVVLDANRAAIESFGFVRDDLVGRKLWDTYFWSHSADVQAGARETIERAARGEIVRRDFVVRVSDGTFITIDATFGPLRDRDGQVVQVIGSAVDITERVRAERESNRVRLQLEQAQQIANVGSWEWEFATGTLDWSEHCYRILGWRPTDRATLERFMDCVHPDDRAKTEASIRDAIGQGSSCDYEHRIIAPDGTVRVLHQLGEVDRDEAGKPVRMVGTTQDVTELWAARAELVESKMRAESANLAKSQFVASMSHELRTPLNAIIGFSELLQNEEIALSEARRLEYARDIHSSGKHLLSVINDILDVSRIEAGKMTMEEDVVAIGELVESAHRMVRPRAEETGVSIRCRVAERLPRVVADRRLLLQTLLNLASNAVKFTERDGRVDILAERSADGGVELVVRDTGIGMAPEDVARVGEPFLQVDGRLSRKYEGTGLGLVIAKRLIELHGGTLVIRSQLGAGTEVTIRLPTSRNGDAAVAVAAAS